MNLRCQTKVLFESCEGLKGWDKHVQMHPKTHWKHKNLNLPNHFAKGFSTILEFLFTFQRLEQNWTIIKSTTHNKSCIWKMLQNISKYYKNWFKFSNISQNGNLSLWQVWNRKAFAWHRTPYNTTSKHRNYNGCFVGGPKNHIRNKFLAYKWTKTMQWN